MKESPAIDKLPLMIKRNNEAPDFPSILVLSRSQMIVERYLQEYYPRLDDYVNEQRILIIDIDIKTLRSWYPTKNWKRDIEFTCKYMMNLRKSVGRKGSFSYFTLLSYANLDEDGLHIHVDPIVMKKYIIGENKPSTSFDYSLSNKFKGIYTHEFYWLMCLNDNPRSGYSFTLDVEWFHQNFDIQYENKDIRKNIIIPVQEEIKRFYDEKLCPCYFEFSECRELIGKNTSIIAWEFKIFNDSRKNKRQLQAHNAYTEVDNFLKKYLPKFRVNVLEQIRVLDSEKIIHIWMRLQKFESSDKDSINNKSAYVYYILQRYGIDPKAKKKLELQPNTGVASPLFEKEERDTAAGISFWLKTIRHIDESPAVLPDVKKLFNQLNFFSYTEEEKENVITFKTSMEVYVAIENNFINEFAEVLKRYFPSPLKVMYRV